MKKGSPWSYQDIDTLKRMWPTKTAAEIAKALGRTPNAVQIKATQMRLKKACYGIMWTPYMEKLLVDHYATMFNGPLALLIGVSERTLIRKARSLGLKKMDGFLEIRRPDIIRYSKEALKRMGYDNGYFQKGVRNNPSGEFKPGHKESPETKAKRSAAIKAAWARRKQANGNNR